MVTLVNRAHMTTATIGTGPITLGVAVTGYQTFADAGVSDGDSVRYTIEDGVAWEIGTGTYTASGTTLTRNVIESSNADAALSLSGSAQVFVAATADDLAYDVADDATPQLGGMLDVNGQAIGDGTRELVTFVEDASAVNHVEIENEATGGGPIVRAAGDDTNIDLNLAGKGTGTAKIGGSAVVIQDLCAPVADGRLTLTSGTPVPTTNVTSAATLYYAEHIGNRIALFDGTRWQLVTFANTSHDLTGGTSGGLYDIFGYLSAGALAIERLAWTDATTRATALTRQDGVFVKSGDATRRYLGTVRMAGAGVSDDTDGGAVTIPHRYVFNAQNRVPRRMYTVETTSSWSYTTQTWRRMNNNTNMQCHVVQGLDIEPVEMMAVAAMTSTSTPSVGIGLDWSSGAPDSDGLWSFGAAGGAFGSVSVKLTKHVGVGYHTLSQLELGNTGATFYGGASTWNCGMTGTVWQ